MSGGWNPAGYGPTGALALDLTRNALNFTNIEYKQCKQGFAFSFQIFALNQRFQIEYDISQLDPITVDFTVCCYHRH